MSHEVLLIAVSVNIVLQRRLNQVFLKPEFDNEKKTKLYHNELLSSFILDEIEKLK